MYVTTSRLMHGFDSIWTDDPILGMLALALMISIAIVMFRVNPYKLKEYYKSLPEDKQMVFGAVCVTVGFLVLIFFLAVWGAGDGWRHA